jgi:tetratricopeptide (TPR) repeat protein
VPKIGRTAIVSLVLASFTLGLFWKATHFQFVEYDDPDYILNNPVVKAGLTGFGIKWALFASYASNWHPLTWVSHMLDCNAFGLNPAGHHATSVVLHAANTVLLFWVLLAMTGRRNSKLEIRNSKQIPNPKLEEVTSDQRQVPQPSTIDYQPSTIWPCAFVAALFALHPMHVESVAWIAERKDVLSTFFFLLTIWAYTAYVKKLETRNSKLASQAPLKMDAPSRETASRNEVETNSKSEIPNPASCIPNPERSTQHPPSHFTFHVSRFTHHSSLFYLLSLAFFALGLMSKPMVVTLPIVLLLLDFWPLGRVESPSSFVKSTSEDKKSKVHPPSSKALRRTKSPKSGLLSAQGGVVNLLREKIPFFALSVFGCVATVWAQRAHGMSDLAGTPFWSRVANALVSYVRYLGKMIWPEDLAVLYPYREWQIWQVLGAAAILLAISFFAWRHRARRPYLAFGWLWYLVTMLPVIGLVQVGIQSMADRYTYIPFIGVFIAVVWLVADLITERAVGSPGMLVRGVAAAFVGGVAVIAFATVTEKQLDYWENSVELFGHTTAVTRNNLRAEYNLGVALAHAGRREEAVEHYNEAIAMTPTPLDRQAGTQWQAHLNKGIVFAESGNWTNAEAEFRTVSLADPRSAAARASLAGCLIQEGRFKEAIAECEDALAMNPHEVQGWRWLGVASAGVGKNEEALRALREAVRLNADGPVELNELAWFLATTADDRIRDGNEAVGLAQRACELTGWREPRCIGTLDAAYAETGQFDDAIKHAQKTRDLALTTGQTAVAEAAEERLQLYSKRQPYRQILKRPPVTGR